MRARAALYHHLQVLFETHLRGVFRYDEVHHFVAKPVERSPGQRRLAFGKLREIVEVGFGPMTADSFEFELRLESPQEYPPLGRISFRHLGDDVLSGPLDALSFDRIGEAIKQRTRQLERTSDV